MQTFGGDFKESGGTEGTVVRRVVRRFIVLAGINAKNGEIAGVARPHPVVGVSPELSDGGRGCTYEANILVDFEDGHEILVAVEVRFDFGVQIGTLHRILFQFFAYFDYFSFVLLIGHVGSQAGVDLVGDIFHAHENGCGDAGISQFLLTGSCPETVTQIVVFQTAVCLNHAECAVVVGDHESLTANQFSGAKVGKGSTLSSQPDHGIFQGCLVDGVDVLCRQPEALALHVFDVVLFEQHGNPHTLVGAATHPGCQERHHDNQCSFFHEMVFIVKIVSMLHRAVGREAP